MPALESCPHLEPCPFCGLELEANWSRLNPRARCATPQCQGAKMPVLNLDDSEQVQQWNRRAAPTPRKPLTDERLNAMRQANGGALNYVTLREFRVIARAVEAEHGITGETK